jgi:biotin carboxyl carrier protein
MQASHSIHAKVNGQFQFTTEELGQLDFIPLDDSHFHILSSGKSYRATLLEADPQRKSFCVAINGSRYDIQLADAYDQMIERMGLSAKVTKQARDVNAPMPGLVLKLMVEPGQAVTAGQALLILEAMKMENVIKAAADATVESVNVHQGDAVEKGYLLIKMKA